jgi:hypothetical protein
VAARSAPESFRRGYIGGYDANSLERCVQVMEYRGSRLVHSPLLVCFFSGSGHIGRSAPSLLELHTQRVIGRGRGGGGGREGSGRSLFFWAGERRTRMGPSIIEFKPR